MDGPPHAGARPGLRPGGERARRDQHGPRRRRDRGARPGLVVQPRHQPDGRGDELHGRLGSADGAHQRHARRARARQHRTVAGRLLPGHQGPRPRRLPRAGAGALVDRRGRRHHGRRLRDRGAVPDAGHHPRRRRDGPGHGAGRPRLPDAGPRSRPDGSSPGPSGRPAAGRPLAAPPPGGAGGPQPPPAGQVRRDRRARGALGGRGPRRRRCRHRRLRHVGPGRAHGGRAGPRAGRPRRHLPPHQPVAVPLGGAGGRRVGRARGRRRRDVGRADGGGRAPGARRPHADLLPGSHRRHGAHAGRGRRGGRPRRRP